MLTVPSAQAADWLAPLPVEALHGIGPKQSTALHDYGVHTVSLLAAISSETVQRLPGGKAGRLAADRARGIDPRPVVPRTLPAAATVCLRVEGHVLDDAHVRAALLGLVVQLGRVLEVGFAARPVP
ncbi:hypothetical protein [Streptomyces sp. DZ1-3]|uniref:hypothetical protein n=1 Tax=Streptomyces sp. DZ1-3 TaxID=3417466 RepID=UPI003CEC626B